jgi:hypothetical protein
MLRRLRVLLYLAAAADALRVPTRRAFAKLAAGVALGAPAVGSAADDSTPMDLGPLGLRKEGASGKLNTCPPQGIKRGCLSTSSLERTEAYVPPWVYQAEDSGAVVAELVRAIEAQPGAAVVDKGAKADGRYVRAVFEVSGPFGKTQTDDVEFLLAKPGTSDPPFLVDYHSVSRPGSGDDVKRHRERIKAIRVELAPSGWKSVGRLLL